MSRVASASLPHHSDWQHGIRHDARCVPTRSFFGCRETDTARTPVINTASFAPVPLPSTEHPMRHHRITIANVSRNPTSPRDTRLAPGGRGA